MQIEYSPEWRPVTLEPEYIVHSSTCISVRYTLEFAADMILTSVVMSNSISGEWHPYERAFQIMNAPNQWHYSRWHEVHGARIPVKSWARCTIGSALDDPDRHEIIVSYDKLPYTCPAFSVRSRMCVRAVRGVDGASWSRLTVEDTYAGRAVEARMRGALAVGRWENVRIPSVQGLKQAVKDIGEALMTRTLAHIRATQSTCDPRLEQSLLQAAVHADRNRELWQQEPYVLAQEPQTYANSAKTDSTDEYAVKLKASRHVGWAHPVETHGHKYA